MAWIGWFCRAARQAGTHTHYHVRSFRVNPGGMFLSGDKMVPFVAVGGRHQCEVLGSTQLHKKACRIELEADVYDSRISHFSVGIEEGRSKSSEWGSVRASIGSLVVEGG